MLTPSVRAILLAAAFCATVTAAVFADEQFSNVFQDGSDNTGLVVQSGSGNALGAASLAARQVGNKNDFSVTQSGSRNKIGFSGTGFAQTGDRNDATIVQTGGGNAVGSVGQQGTSGAITLLATNVNILSITQDNGASSVGNTIETVSQIRSGSTSVPFLGTVDLLASNTANLAQSGGGSNRIVSLSQTGRAHAADLSQTGTGNHVGAVEQTGTLQIADIEQIGSANVVNGVWQHGTLNVLSITIDGDSNGQSAWPDLHGLSVGEPDSVFIGRGLATSYQSGSANAASLLVSGDRNQFHIEQNGELNVSVGVLAGDDNASAVRQNDGAANFASYVVSGDRNHIYIDQLEGPNSAITTVAGNDNHVSLTQVGTNDAEVNILGDGNLSQVSQAGNNTLSLNIFGNNNNSGVFTKAALNIAGQNLPSALLPGQVLQSGSNTLEYALGASGSPANNNLFAFAQTGNGNSIIGKTLGNFNEVALIQSGNANKVEFSQDGEYNNIGGIVSGDDNYASIVQTGSGNLTWFSQNGVGNFADVKQ